MDHIQIQTIRGRPFLKSCHVIPCFKVVTLEHTTIIVKDVTFKHIKQIEGYNYKIFEEGPELVEEFICLCS